MSFVYPLAFLLLVIIVPLFFWLDYRWNKAYKIKREHFADVNFIDRYWPISAKAPRVIGQLLWISALMVLVVAISRPQGNRSIKQLAQPQRIGYIVIDGSTSMKVADAQGSRFERAKRLAIRLAEVQDQDRLGLILFEKDANQLCPVTTDQDAFLLALNRARVNSLSKPGSDLEGALLLAIEKCKQWSKEEKYIILISDGESHIPTNWQQLVAEVKKTNVTIITIGVGTKTGGFIYQGENMWGKKQYKTYKGKRVISKLKSENLIDIARLTQGRYYHWQQPLIIRSISQQLKTLNPASGSTSVIVYQEWAYYFIFLGLLLLLLETFLPKIIMRKVS